MGRRCRWRERAGLNGRQGVRQPDAGSDDVRRSGDDGARAARRRDHGRDHVPRQHHDEGLSEEPARHRGVLCRRLVPHRRPRGDRAGRLCEDQGPLEGHHHLRRREHFLLEVEDVLYRHQDVLAAAVVAAARREMGRGSLRLHRTAAKAPSRREDELLDHCREHMARFKVPKIFIFGALPRTSTGKIQKFVLREKAKSAEAIGDARIRHPGSA